MGSKPVRAPNGRCALAKDATVREAHVLPSTEDRQRSLASAERLPDESEAWTHPRKAGQTTVQLLSTSPNRRFKSSRD